MIGVEVRKHDVLDPSRADVQLGETLVTARPQSKSSLRPAMFVRTLVLRAWWSSWHCRFHGSDACADHIFNLIAKAAIF